MGEERSVKVSCFGSSGTPECRLCAGWGTRPGDRGRCCCLELGETIQGGGLKQLEGAAELSKGLLFHRWSKAEEETGLEENKWGYRVRLGGQEGSSLWAGWGLPFYLLAPFPRLASSLPFPWGPCLLAPVKSHHSHVPCYLARSVLTLGRLGLGEAEDLSGGGGPCGSPG